MGYYRVSHACMEMRRLYHKHDRVAASWPAFTICSNNWVRWYTISQAWQGCSKLTQHLLFAQIIELGDIPFHKHDRISASWPAFTICSNNLLYVVRVDSQQEICWCLAVTYKILPTITLHWECYGRLSCFFMLTGGEITLLYIQQICNKLAGTYYLLK